MDPKDIEPYLENARHIAQNAAELTRERLDEISSLLHTTLSSSKWIPEKLRPTPPPPPVIAIPQSLAQRLLDRITTTARENPFLTSSLISLTVITSAYYARLKLLSLFAPLRRAKKAKSGARTEIVLVSGSIRDPLLRHLIHDLERRGFIVFVIVSSYDDERTVKTEYTSNYPDIKPLRLDSTDPETTGLNLTNLNAFISNPHRPPPSFEKHYNRLKGLILLPSGLFPDDALEDLAPESFSPMMIRGDPKAYAPITNLQHLLPQLRHSNAAVITLTQATLPPSPRAPALIAAGSQWHRWAGKVRAPSVWRFRLGVLDRGSMHELCHKVFDCLEGQGGSGTLFCGAGGRRNHVLGTLGGAGLVGWMVGMGDMKEAGRARERYAGLSLGDLVGGLNAS